MSSLAVILYAHTHQPRGGYAAMFRCVARLRAQQTHTHWYAAFGNDAPSITHIAHDARRYGARKTLIIPWTLEVQPQTPDIDDSTVTVTSALGTHPLVHEIFVQRAYEAHYLRNPTTFQQQSAHVIFVHEAHTQLLPATSFSLDEVLAHRQSYTTNTILQPLALSHNDHIMRQLIYHTAQDMPLAHCGVGQALGYDRRLLTIIADLVHRNN